MKSLNDVLNATLKKYGRINEDVAIEPPYDYGSIQYMTEDLTKYTYYVFENNTILQKFDKSISDINFTEDVITVDVRKDPEKSRQWIILFNPYFAQLLLQRSCEMHDEWDYNEEHDQWCFEYNSLFFAALLYACGLAMVNATETSGTNPAEILATKAHNYAIAVDEVYESYKDKYDEELSEVLRLIGEYKPEL